MGWIQPEQAARWTGGQWTCQPEGDLAGAIQDTRLIEPGMVYVALRGARVDGHDFLEASAKAGAAAALCEKGRGLEGLPCLEVTDPAQALMDLARGWRRTLKVPVVGITGSAGKTTAKELLRAMLGVRGPVAATRGNWNNAIGLPLSVLSMTPDHVFGVFELGMNQPGEIMQLASVLQPDAGWVTGIGEAHLEKLGTVEAIAAEKASLLSAIPENGLGVVDLDSRWMDLLRSELRGRVLSCSLNQEADVTGSRQAATLEIKAGGDRIVLPVPGPGEHMCRNMLQVAAMAWGLGLSLEDMARGLESYTAPPMRWETVEQGSQIWINDAYNANPMSMRAAIRAFGEMPDRDEKWLVLGGMAELGASAEELHVALGKELGEGSWSGILGVGEAARPLVDGVGRDVARWVESPKDAMDILKDAAGPEAAILVKGSRSAGLDRLFSDDVFNCEENSLS